MIDQHSGGDCEPLWDGIQKQSPSSLLTWAALPTPPSPQPLYPLPRGLLAPCLSFRAGATSWLTIPKSHGCPSGEESGKHESLHFPLWLWVVGSDPHDGKSPKHGQGANLMWWTPRFLIWRSPRGSPRTTKYPPSLQEGMSDIKRPWTATRWPILSHNSPFLHLRRQLETYYEVVGVHFTVTQLPSPFLQDEAFSDPCPLTFWPPDPPDLQI